jgi:hypothetical protein
VRRAEAQVECLRRAAEAGSNLPLFRHNLAEEIESLADWNAAGYAVALPSSSSIS